MKHLILIPLLTFCLVSFSQNKYDFITYDKLTSVEGTDYVIANVDNWGKMYKLKNNYFLFINTRTGQLKQVDFPNRSYVATMDQLKIDSLGINCLLFTAKTVDLDEKRGIDWNDPTQIIIISPDGNTIKQLTDSKLFVSKWVVNRTTGTITVTGYYDSNNNGKYDKTDKTEIGIYDLRSLKLLHQL